MTRAWVRSIGGAAAALALIGLGELTYFTAFCPQHRAWVRTEQDPSGVVQDHGYRVARPGDAIYVCTVPHCVGPLCHEDRACYCAPLDLGAAALGRQIPGACALDKSQPSRLDAFGACRYARCDTHIN